MDPSNERSALIQKPGYGDDESQHESDEGKGRWHNIRLIASEYWLLLKDAVPVILAYALQNSLQTLSIFIVGRLGSEELSVAAFCYMFAMATGCEQT